MTIVHEGKTHGAVPTYYEINVSQNGHHLFATHKRSIEGQAKADMLLKLFREKFPKEDGYKVTCTAEYEFGINYEDEEG